LEWRIGETGIAFDRFPKRPFRGSGIAMPERDPQKGPRRRIVETEGHRAAAKRTVAPSVN
ncbi:hypothetical protein B4Q13_22470, partial [Lacticaseibacillus rhamnosus]